MKIANIKFFLTEPSQWVLVLNEIIKSILFHYFSMFDFIFCLSLRRRKNSVWVLNLNLRWMIEEVITFFINLEFGCILYNHHDLYIVIFLNVFFNVLLTGYWLYKINLNFAHNHFALSNNNSKSIQSIKLCLSNVWLRMNSRLQECISRSATKNRICKSDAFLLVQSWNMIIIFG